MRRLAAHAAAAGAEIVEGTPCRRSRRSTADARRRRGRRRARRRRSLPELAARSSPGARARCSPRSRSPSGCSSGRTTPAHGFDYWQQLPDGRLVVGGKRDASLETEYTDVEETTPLVQERLDDVRRRAGRRALPAVTHRWAGIWGETPDRLPLAGPVPGRDRRLDRGRLLGSRQRARASRAATSSRARSSVRAARARALRPGRRLEPYGSTPARRRAETGAQPRPCGAAAAVASGTRRRRRRQSSNRRHVELATCASAAIAIARSWIASPVESNVVISSAPRPARRVAGEHGAELVTSSAPDEARLDRVRELAAVARLLPVVAEDRACARARPAAISALPGPVGAHQAHVLARPRASPRSSSTSWPGVTVTSRSARERLLERARDRRAELVGRARARAPRRRPRARPRGRARGTSAPPRGRSRRRRSRPRVAASARPSVSAASTAAAPVRSAVTRRRRAPPRAARRRRSRAARARSPSAGRAPGCPGTTSPT